MAVAKKKPAETEGAKVPAAVDTMPDILLYVEKKDYRRGSSAPPSPRSGLGVPRMKGFRCPKDTAAQRSAIEGLRPSGVLHSSSKK